MSNWSEIQGKAKTMITEGLDALKQGVHEAGFLAETTASAAKLKVDVGRNRLEMHRVFHELGKVLYTEIKSNPKSDTVQIADEISKLFHHARNLEEAAAESGKQLRQFSVVRKPFAPHHSLPSVTEVLSTKTKTGRKKKAS